MLHLMLPQMGWGTALVRSTWIVTSRDQGARAMEGQHAVVVPKLDPLVQRLRRPQASTGGGIFCTSVQFNTSAFASLCALPCLRVNQQDLVLACSNVPSRCIFA